MTDLITSATTETAWARALRLVLLRTETTPIYDETARHIAERLPVTRMRRVELVKEAT